MTCEVLNYKAARSPKMRPTYGGLNYTSLGNNPAKKSEGEHSPKTKSNNPKAGV